MPEELPHSVLSVIVDIGGEAHFRQIACQIQKQTGVFPRGLIWTLYGLEKNGFLSSFLVPDPMSEVSGLLEGRVFRIEERGRQALSQAAALEPCSELSANPLLNLVTSLKKLREQPEAKLESKTLDALFDEAMVFWKGFGPWLPRPSLEEHRKREKDFPYS